MHKLVLWNPEIKMCVVFSKSSDNSIVAVTLVRVVIVLFTNSSSNCIV